MEAFAEPWVAAKIIVLLAGLLGPGAAVMHACRLPLTPATCFGASAVSIYATVLALQLTSVRISLGSLSGGLVFIALVAAGAARIRSSAARQPFPTTPPLAETEAVATTRFRTTGAWTALYAVFWLAVVWRAFREPLAGPDVGFRWSFLAEQMLRFGTLDFYPPRSAADFAAYFWVESVPPGTSALHAWAYACAGGPAGRWTVAAVGLQIWSLHELLWRTARQAGGLRAARLTCLTAAACPLLTWSLLLGQETGLTSLALVGIAFALQGWQQNRAPAWAALAGAFAVLGASAREYGLVFPVLAAVGLALLRADRQAWFAFAAVAVLSLVWPLRTFLLTGNPVYSLALGVFPTNARFVSWIEHDAEALGSVIFSISGWREIGRYLLFFSPGAIIGGFVLIAATVRGRRPAWWAFLACAVFAGLWAFSVRYTNGGLFYSLRVTSPIVALAALAAGVGLASLTHPRLRRLEIPIVGLITAVTLPATLALPRNPWTTPPQEWPAFATSATGTATDPTLEIIRRAVAVPADSNPAAPRVVVLSDAPGIQKDFVPAGIVVVPLWSPQADWLFDASLPDAEAVNRWRESGIRHIIITKFQTNLDFFNRHSRWSRPPFQLQMLGETSLNAVFAIRAVD